MGITDIVMDFDGTCTQIPVIYKPFLAEYLAGLNKTVFAQDPVSPKEWMEAQEQVRKHSPRAAWTIATAPAGPAAADPYIFSSECGKYLLRKKNISKDIPIEVFVNAQTPNPAPWRPEARNIFETLLKQNIRVTFISNTGSATIIDRLKTLLSVTELPNGLAVRSGAQKFNIAELTFDSKIPADVQKLFQHLPVVHSDTGIGRPVHLRRAAYFEAICSAFGNDLGRMATSVFCGDIWEMDLAMPYMLGANINLVERAAPFDTYEFERKGVSSAGRRGKISKDLNGLLEWIK